MEQRMLHIISSNNMKKKSQTLSSKNLNSLLFTVFANKCLYLNSQRDKFITLRLEFNL